MFLLKPVTSEWERRFGELKRNPSSTKLSFWWADWIWSSCFEEIFTEIAEGKIVLWFFFSSQVWQIWTMFSPCLKKKGAMATPQPPSVPQPSCREPSGLFVLKKKKKSHLLDSDGADPSLLSPVFFKTNLNWFSSTFFKGLAQNLCLGMAYHSWVGEVTEVFFFFLFPKYLNTIYMHTLCTHTSSTFHIVFHYYSIIRCFR